VRRRESNRAQRARLEAGLDALGIGHLPSETNFVCAVVDDAPALAARLAEHGVLVRSLDDLDRPDLLRITVGDADAVDAVLAGLTSRG
jgi:histidinol-phosphate/aromatic aminotransferase/cobyric acid decarboxylase-like protein